MILLKRVALISLVALLPYSAAKAGFSIAEVDTPNEFTLPSHPQLPEPDYGRSQTSSFYHAMQGNTGMTSRERSHLSRIVRSPIKNQWYVKFGVRYVSSEAEDIERVPPSPVELVTKSDTKGKVFNFELGLGYKWTNWRWDIEFIRLQSVDYDPSPVLGGAPVLLNMKSAFDARVINFNLYRDFPVIFQLHPYAGASLGFAMKEVEAEFRTVPGAPVLRDTTDTGSLAWSVTGGARYRLTEKFWIDLSYRYMNLGKLTWGSISGFESAGFMPGFNLETDCYTSSGIGLAINYQF